MWQIENILMLSLTALLWGSAAIIIHTAHIHLVKELPWSKMQRRSTPAMNDNISSWLNVGICSILVSSVWGARRFNVWYTWWRPLSCWSVSPPAGRLECCCGRSCLWVTCRIRVKPTKRCWSLSLPEAGWILPRAAQGPCEYCQEVCRKRWVQAGSGRVSGSQCFTKSLLRWCKMDPQFQESAFSLATLYLSEWLDSTWPRQNSKWPGSCVIFVKNFK